MIYRGGWVGAHSCAHPDLIPSLSALLIGHPSVQLEAFGFGGDTQALFDRISVPTLLLPAKGDSTDYHVGGPWFDSVARRFPTSKSVVFPEVLSCTLCIID